MLNIAVLHTKLDSSVVEQGCLSAAVRTTGPWTLIATAAQLLPQLHSQDSKESPWMRRNRGRVLSKKQRYQCISALMHSKACGCLLKVAFCSIASPEQAMKLHLSTAAERSSVCQEGAENHVQGRGGKTAQTHGCTSIIYCPVGVTCASTVTLDVLRCSCSITFTVAKSLLSVRLAYTSKLTELLFDAEADGRPTDSQAIAKAINYQNIS